MSSPIISVKNIGKKYKLGATLGGRNYKTLRDVLTQAAFGPIRKLSAFFVERIKFVDFYGWMHF
jgi:hypothetical protein